jgi:hypothetical protein
MVTTKTTRATPISWKVRCGLAGFGILMAFGISARHKILGSILAPYFMENAL